MSEPVYFLKLEMENVRCFGEKAVLDLSDGQGNWRQWTVILGDNGTGKTTILQILAASEIIYQVNSGDEINYFYGPSGFPSSYRLATYNHDNKKVGYSHAIVSVENKDGWPVDYIGLAFLGDQQSGITPTNNDKLLELKCFGYGANRFMSKVSLPENKSENSETLFNDDAKLINAEEWLLRLDYAASKDSKIQQFAINKRNQVQQILIDLLPDVSEIRFTTPTKENLQSSVQFKTELSGWVSIHQLSLGYKTMVAWMVDLAARLFERYPDSDNPLAEPAIVLVDEIDLHMHPKWQRKIFEYLTERFPKTQFVVTAHSPLVVQAAPADANIVLLKKEGDHVVIDNDIESVHNWRLDQIMNSLYGIESTRGPETEKWLAERKGLLQKQELTADEQERLTELNEKSRSLPTADNAADINAMEIIRKAAEYLQSQKA
jgi:predicted ATP-binding protein involved in virulence